MIRIMILMLIKSTTDGTLRSFLITSFLGRSLKLRSLTALKNLILEACTLEISSQESPYFTAVHLSWHWRDL